MRGEVSALLQLRNKLPLSKTRWPSAHYFQCCHNPTESEEEHKKETRSKICFSHYFINIAANALIVQPWTCQKQPGYTLALRLNPGSFRPRGQHFMVLSEGAPGLWEQEAGELQTGLRLHRALLIMSGHHTVTEKRHERQNEKRKLRGKNNLLLSRFSQW